MRKALKTRVLDTLGIEIQQSATLSNFLRTREIDLVIDAGANLGQFARSIRSKGYRGRITSFEPVQYVFNALQHRASKDPLWTVSRAGLGSTLGTANINVMGNHTLSSFRKPTDLIRGYDKGTEVRTEQVPVVTLDHAIGNDPARSIFLKIDVQGYEKEVLQGATEILKRTIALYLELPVRHLYEGCWTFRDAIGFIDDLGFEPAQFRTVSPQANDPASAIEFDCLFRRKD